MLIRHTMLRFGPVWLYRTVDIEISSSEGVRAAEEEIRNMDRYDAWLARKLGHAIDEVAMAFKRGAVEAAECLLAEVDRAFDSWAHETERKMVRLLTQSLR